MLAGCKQSLYPEYATQQDASSSSLFGPGSRIKSPPTRSSDPSSPTVKLPPTLLMGKVRSFVQDQGMQHPLPHLAGRNPLLEQTLSPKAGRYSSKGSSDERNPSQSSSNEHYKEISVKSIPYRQAISAKLQKGQWPSRLKNRNGDISLAWD